MRRALGIVAIVGLLIVAYAAGHDRGITVGVEETTRFYLHMLPPCGPGPHTVDVVPIG